MGRENNRFKIVFLHRGEVDKLVKDQGGAHGADIVRRIRWLEKCGAVVIDSANLDGNIREGDNILFAGHETDKPCINFFKKRIQEAGGKIVEDNAFMWRDL